jgi:hypothetical protein
VALVVAGLAYVLGYGQHLMSKGPRHLHDWSRSAFTVGALSLGMVLAALWIGQEWPAWVFRGYCHIWLFQTTAAVMLLGWLQYRGHRWRQAREGA